MKSLPLNDGIERPTVYDRLCGLLPSALFSEVGENRVGNPMRPDRALTLSEAKSYVQMWTVVHGKVWLLRDEAWCRDFLDGLSRPLLRGVERRRTLDRREVDRNQPDRRAKTLCPHCFVRFLTSLDLSAHLRDDAGAGTRCPELSRRNPTVG